MFFPKDSVKGLFILPLADGGEGTVETLTGGLGGTIRRPEVTGPLGETVTGRYGILADGVTAVMEMADTAEQVFRLIRLNDRF